MRIVFHGVGAFVGRIDGEQRCGVWTRHPVEINFDPVLLVPVDLARSPMRVASGAIDADQVEVDDHVSYDTGGLTTIGPVWPGSPAVGTVYLAESYLAKLRPEIRPAVPAFGFEDEAHPYELQSVVYVSAGKPARRYYGFHGEIKKEGKKTATVALFHGGKGKGKKPAGVHEIALDALDQVDAHVGQGGMTEIAMGRGRPKSGAVYVTPQLRQVVALDWPKIPKSAQR